MNQHTIKKYLKAKEKSYNGKINTNFHNNKISKDDSQHIFLSVILIDSVLEQVKIIIHKCFQKNAKYVVKQKKIPQHVIDDIEISSDSGRENSDKESSDEEISDEVN